ncbi:MAG: hypothetical protein AB2A00_25445 [Myxococcota bacterium]
MNARLISRSLIALTVLASSVAMAESAKNSMAVGEINVLPRIDGASGASEGEWATILSSTLRMSQQKDLVATVSLQTGLFTDTLVRSKTGTSDTSTAEAGIEVRVLVDGVEAAPGVVVFDRRTQTLMAKFGGVLNECRDLNDDGTITGNTECSWSDEELQLVLDTMGARAFTFALNDVGVGDHVIEVQARISTYRSSQTGASNAGASIGKGSLTLEEVRLVRTNQLIGM